MPFAQPVDVLIVQLLTQVPALQARLFAQLLALHSQVPPTPRTGFVGSLRRQAPLELGVALHEPSSLQYCEPQIPGAVVQGWQACVVVSQTGVVPVQGLVPQSTQPDPEHTVLPLHAPHIH